jgi:N4-gp56 family major capsid protein
MALNVNLTSTSGLNDASAIYYDRKLLTRLMFQLYLQESAEKRTLPKGNGTQIQFLRPSNLAAITTPLSEGTNPNGQAWQSTKILSTPVQYGGFLAYSDRLMLEAYDNITEAMHDVLGYQAGLSLDTILRIALTGFVTTQFTGTAVSEATVSVATAAVDFRKAAKALKSLAVLPFEDGCYHAVVHPATSADLQADPAAGGWLDVNRYVSIADEHHKVLVGELGKLVSCRFQESQNIFVNVGGGAAGATTYHSFVFGQQGVGSVDVANQGIQKIVHQPGDSGVADPLNLNGTIGWKTYAVFPILDANRIIELIGTSNY